MALVKNDGLSCSCNCGWSYTHKRDKIREDAIDRHLSKQHDGRGMRL